MQTAPSADGKTERQINQSGLDLIKSFEACRLTAYQDQGGVWTIGWGCTKNVVAGMIITQSQADTWLLQEIGIVEGYLWHWLPQTLNDNQFSACVSLAYNIGIGNFEHSTLLKCLKANDITGAAQQFLVWDKVKGVPDDGLLRRRKAEQALFNTK